MTSQRRIIKDRNSVQKFCVELKIEAIKPTTSTISKVDPAKKGERIWKLAAKLLSWSKDLSNDETVGKLASTLALMERQDHLNMPAAALKRYLERIIDACERDEQVVNDIIACLDRTKEHPLTFAQTIADLRNKSNEGKLELQTAAHQWIMMMNLSEMGSEPKKAPTPQLRTLRKAVLWNMLEYDIIVDALRHGKAEERKRAATLLGEVWTFAQDDGKNLKVKRIVYSLIGALRDAWDVNVSIAAAESLGKIGWRIRNIAPEVIPHLKKEMNSHESREMQEALREALVEITG